MRLDIISENREQFAAGLLAPDCFMRYVKKLKKD